MAQRTILPLRPGHFFDTALNVCKNQDYRLRCAALGKRFNLNNVIFSNYIFERQHFRKIAKNYAVSRHCNVLGIKFL